MSSYETMMVIEKAKIAVGEVTYYDREHLELFARFVGLIVDELIAGQDEPKNA